MCIARPRWMLTRIHNSIYTSVFSFCGCSTSRLTSGFNLLNTPRICRMASVGKRNEADAISSKPVTSSTSTQGNEYTQTSVHAGTIAFAVGQPSPSLWPRKQIADAMHAVANEIQSSDSPLSSALSYGASSGCVSFRQCIANFVLDSCDLPTRKGIDAKEVALTAGTSSALAMITSSSDLQEYINERQRKQFGEDFSATRTKRKRICIMEDPSYFLARTIMKGSGLETIGCPIDDEGICPTALEHLVKSHRPEFVYIIPTYHNPTGCVLSPKRRQQIVQMSREYAFMIISDEPYNFLQFHATDQKVIAPFATQFPDADMLISLVSFSKILAPGLRLGWLHADAGVVGLLEDHGVISSGGFLNPMSALLVHQLMQTGDLMPYIQRLCSVFSTRMDALCDALHTHMPTAKFRRPEGGYFLWVRLPMDGDPTTAQELLSLAQTHGVSFLAGDCCSVSPLEQSASHAPYCLRISIAFHSESEIQEGVHILGQCLDTLNAHK
eukprot:m.199049 g.199049  ORF g.199049 m.199049 type:complete len:497 (+) comp18772_c0_seq1:204-1694(+)